MNLAAFQRRFLARFSLRWHMTLVLTATVLAGLCLSRLLWWAGLQAMIWRFPLVLLLSYGCFLLLIRLLLIYLTEGFDNKRRSTAGDLVDSTYIGGGGGSSSGGGGGSTASGETPFQGGGSGGGGASGSFGDGEAPALALAVAPDSSSSTVGESAGKAAGEAVSGLGDDGIWVFIAVGLILVAVAGSAVFIVYEAPAILFEAAFQCLLAGGLLKKARQSSPQDWLGSVWRHTWKPLAFTMVLTVAAAFMLGRWCPQASKISEALRQCL